MLIFIGVLVSPSAKNARARMLTVENATSPGARHIERERRAGGGGGGECAVLEQQPHNRFGQHDEQNGGDQIQKTAACRGRAAAWREIRDNFFPPPDRKASAADTSPAKCRTCPAAIPSAARRS